MTSPYWAKLWIDMIDDKKVAKMSDLLFRRFVFFILAAKEYDKDGLLGPLDDLAWRIRCTPDEIESALRELAQLGITKHTNDGWLLVNFEKRQAVSNSAMRVRRYRERHRNASICNESNTAGNALEEEEDTEEEDINTTATPPKRPNVYTLYQQNLGIITPIIQDKLDDLEKTYPFDWIEWAIGQAVMNNKPSLSYAEACLRNRRAGNNRPMSSKRNNGSKPLRPLPPGADESDRTDLENIRMNLNYPDLIAENYEQLHQKGITDDAIAAYCN